MSALASAGWQETLIPQRRDGSPRWRSGVVRGARVLATNRTHTLGLQAAASRIFGTPAFPSYRSHRGVVYGRVEALVEEVRWEPRFEHEGCDVCHTLIVPAIAHAAETMQGVGAATLDQPVYGDDEDGWPVVVGVTTHAAAVQAVL